jgi:holin-like protein
MKYIKQFCIIIGITFLGEVLKVLLPFPIPASIYGLLLMFGALCSGIMKLEQVEDTADFLVGIMPVLFIPAGVGLMKEWEILSQVWLPLAVIIVVSTITVMVVTGCVAQGIIQREKGEKGNQKKSSGKGKKV